MQLFIADIMSKMLWAFIVLSLFVLSVDFIFYHFLFGGGFCGFLLSGKKEKVTDLTKHRGKVRKTYGSWESAFVVFQDLDQNDI